MISNSPIRQPETFKDLFTKHAAAALAKQFAFAEVVPHHECRYIHKEGKLDFGNGRSFEVQVLGTESDKSKTWLWSWANEASNFPAQCLEKVNSLKALGDANRGLIELSSPRLSLREVDGHKISMVASELYGADCFWRMPYEGGALFMLVYGAPIDRLKASSPQLIGNVISATIRNFGNDLDHRKMIMSFLEGQGYSVFVADNSSLAMSKNHQSITFKFNDQGRLEEIAI